MSLAICEYVVRASDESLKGEYGLSKKFGIIEAPNKDIDTERKRNKSWYSRSTVPLISMFYLKILAKLRLRQDMEKRMGSSKSAA